MAVQVSSLIGANFAAPDTTALFALGSRAQGTDDTWWEYVEATSTFTTGQLCVVNAAGTARVVTTAMFGAPGVWGLDFGFPQFLVSQGEFAWIAKQGRNLYVKTTGTIAAGTGVALSTGGKLYAMTVAAAGETMAGIQITTSSSTGTAAVAIATVTWPRVLTTTGVIT